MNTFGDFLSGEPRHHQFLAVIHLGCALEPQPLLARDLRHGAIRGQVAVQDLQMAWKQQQ